MGELSDRFADLMARMAKSDADLFRTIGEQNASVRQMVDDLAPAAQDIAGAPANTALAPAALLPPEDCNPKALKARFGKVADAQSWIESQIGKAPKKATWLVIEQTCRSGAWPAAAKRAADPLDSESSGSNESMNNLESCIPRKKQRKLAFSLA